MFEIEDLKAGDVLAHARLGNVSINGLRSEYDSIIAPAQEFEHGVVNRCEGQLFAHGKLLECKGPGI